MYLFQQLSSVECGKGCEAAINGDVVWGHKVGALAVVKRRLKELPGR